MMDTMQNPSKNSTASCWYIEAICLGVTIGFSEVLLAIYYGSMDLDPILLAVFMTVPAAFGAIAQVALTRLKNLFTSARDLASASIAVQITGLLTMCSALAANDSDHAMMFIGQCLYWIGGMTSSSPTQEILANNIEASRHNRFFSGRAMLMTILTLICNLSSARFLSAGLNAGLMSNLLAIAAAARGISLIMVMMYGGRAAVIRERDSRNAPQEAIVPIFKLSVAMLLFRCAVNLSSPFYSAYMLRDIRLDYSVYSLLTAIPLITKSICLTNWARLLDDNRKFEGLAIATFAIGMVPVLWAVGASPAWLGTLQVISGLSWAGFDLISILLVQHMYPRSITQKLGLFLAFSSIGSVLGGLLGGVILKLLGSYHALFAISGVLRLATGFGLLWYLRRHHLFRFQNLRLRSGLATLVTVRPSLEAAAKILPLPAKKYPRGQKVA
jgi:hypothetical protein